MLCNCSLHQLLIVFGISIGLVSNAAATSLHSLMPIDEISVVCGQSTSGNVVVALHESGIITVVDEVDFETQQTDSSPPLTAVYRSQCDPLLLCDCTGGGTCLVRKSYSCGTCAANHCSVCCSYFVTGAARTRCCANQCNTIC